MCLMKATGHDKATLPGDAREGRGLGRSCSVGNLVVSGPRSTFPSSPAAQQGPTRVKAHVPLGEPTVGRGRPLVAGALASAPVGTRSQGWSCL